MKNLTALKFKQRIYDKANSITWLTALLVLSLALVFNVSDAPPTIYIIPVLFGVSLLLVLMTNSLARFILSALCYVIILIIISTIFSTSMSIDPNGVLSLVWFGVLISNVFATLTLTFIIRTVNNRHFLALKTTILNVLLVMLTTYLLGTYILPEDTEALTFMLTTVFVSFFIVLVGTFIYLLISSRAYRFSLGRKKILGAKFRNPEKETLNKMEDDFIRGVTKAAKKNDYTFKTYKVNGRKQGYIYKDNATIVLMPVELGFTHNKDKLYKSAKVSKKKFDKIFYSIINHFSARTSLPDSPVIIAFITQNTHLNNVTMHTINSSESPINVNFLPMKKLSEWLNDIEDENSDTIVIFPELNEKQVKNRENADFMTQIYPVPIKNNENDDNKKNENNTVDKITKTQSTSDLISDNE